MKRKLFLMAMVMMLLTGAASVQAAAGEASPATPAAGKMTIYYLDATLGDIAYIRTAAGEDVLIGGGGTKAAGTKAVAALKALGVKDLEIVVATNPNNERTAALVEVVKALKVKALYAPAVSRSTADYKLFLAAAKQKKLAVQTAKPGVKLTLKDVTSSFVGPLKAYASGDKSNGSAVLRVQYGSNSFLFAGDAGTKAETDMVLSGKSLKADVLKVSGQGAGATAGPAFLKAVQPKYAVIGAAAGDTPNFPAEKLLKSLAGVKATVYRTDLNGWVTAVSDGKKVEMATEKQDRVLAVYKGGYVTVREFAGYIAFLSGVMNAEVSATLADPATKELRLKEYIGYRMKRAALSDKELLAWQEQAGQFADQIMDVAAVNEVFKKYVADTGLDRETVLAMYQLAAAVQTKISADVTEKEMQAVFEASNDGRNYVNVRHILISTEEPASGQTAADADKAAHEEALKVKRLLENGGSWTALALKYSDDPGSKNNGGLYEGMDPQGTVEPFKVAAETQPVGEIGLPVKSEFGYHVILVEKRGALTYGDLSEQQKDGLRNQAFQTNLNAYFETEVPKLITDLKIL